MSNYEGKHFTRRTGSTITEICYTLFFVLAFSLSLWCSFLTGENPEVEFSAFPVLLQIGIFVLFVWAIVIFTLLFTTPPMFDYYIKGFDTFVVFQFSENDRRTINKSYSITETRKYLFLDDGYTRLKIAYNKDSKEFIESLKVQDLDNSLTE